MSAFYGLVEGNRSAATRGGSKNSGFRSSCQSYDGSVIATMRYDSDNQLVVRVGTNDGSSCYTDYNSPDFEGTFEEFKELLQLAKDIKERKVSITRHRAKSNRELKLERAFRKLN